MRDLHAGAEVGVLGDGGQPLVRGLGHRLVAAGRGSTRTRAPARDPPGRAAGAAGTAPAVSARSTTRVLALEMSSPDSTIVVQTRTSARFSQKSTMTCSSSVLAHLPVGDGDRWPRGPARAAGRRPARSSLDPVVDVEDLALAQQLAPDRRPHLALRRTAPTKVSTGCRSSGGVVMTDMSRMPVIDISRVRGIGVALMVSTSTWTRSSLIRSLCSTPKRCSSSTTSRPRSLNRTSPVSSRWVPITTSTLPSARPASTARASRVALEAGQRPHGDRERRVALAEGQQVLLHQQRGGDEHGRLLALLHRLEHRPHRDLGLAVADVTGDRRDPSGTGTLHVGLDLVDGLRAGPASRRRGRRPPARAARGCRARTRAPARPGARRTA